MMLQSADLARHQGSSILADHAAGSLIHAAPYSVAVEIPDHRVSSAVLAEQLGTTEDWIVSRTGVRERPVALPEERLSDYAARAGAAALERAGVDASEVDLVLAATMTEDELTPYTSTLVAHELGAHHAGAFDVGAACTGFLSAVAIAAAQIEAGRCRHVLVIGADFLTRLTDPADRRATPLFGDAAGAAVFGPAGDGCGRIGPIVLGADGSEAARAIVIDHHDRKIQMDGPEVYRHAVARMVEATFEALDRAGLTLDDIDLFAFHQANRRITRALGERLGLDPERVVDCIEMLGNSSAATLPVALATAEADGRLKPGTRVLLAAFGGGFTWGGGVIEWGGGER